MSDETKATERIEDVDTATLQRRYRWQVAGRQHGTYSMGVCGHNARGGWTCEACLVAELKRRGVEPEATQ